MVSHSTMPDEVIGNKHREDGQEHAPYEYEPIQSSKHIRLVKLALGQQDAPLRCSLIRVDSEAQHYEATSCAWGDPKDVRYIECDGRQLSITRNLYEALWHFRHVGQPRYLWADAISINQQHLGERSAQVQLMASIYSKTSKVLLWLGTHESEAVGAAFEAFN